MKHGKKYVEAAKAVDRATLYDPNEAISLVKKLATAKFDETIEAHIRTGCDGRHADQQIRGAVVLPHGTGKKVRVLVFAKNAKADEAVAAGAEYVGAEELIPKIQNEGWFDFDVVVATPDMMGVVGRLGRVLGHHSRANRKSFFHRGAVSGQLPDAYGSNHQSETVHTERSVLKKRNSRSDNGTWCEDQPGEAGIIAPDIFQGLLRQSLTFC